MKSKIVILTMLTIAHSAFSGPIKTQVTTNPESVKTLLESGSYSDVLAFARNAYAESKSEADDETTQYAYLFVLSSASEAMRLPLATDFALDVNDIALNAQAANSVCSSILGGIVPTQEQKQQVIAKLKTKLIGLTSPSSGAYELGQNASNALIVLGDDAGLDIFLTNTQNITNYSKKDGWTPTSEASVFQQLKQQYDLLGSNTNNTNREPDKIMAAAYELCRIRRTQNKEIKAIQPLVNLDSLLPK